MIRLDVASWVLALGQGMFVVMAAVGKMLRNRNRTLAHPMRLRILSAIHDRPGTSISELCARLASQWGTVHHHLQVLEAERLIRGIVEGRSHRYFLPGTPPDEAARIALLRRARILMVARAVALQPGVIQRDVTRIAGVSRKMFRTYVELLAQSGLLQEVRQSGRCRYYPTHELMRVIGAEAEDESWPHKSENSATFP